MRLTSSNQGNSDEDSDNEQTVVPQSVWANRSQVRHLSADDRPITPMKNTMVYNTQNSSLDFEDGI